MKDRAMCHTQKYTVYPHAAYTSSLDTQRSPDTGTVTGQTFKPTSVTD